MSARQGNPAAQYQLALCYEQGEGVGKDLQQAYIWFSLAAAQGDANAVGDLNKLENELSPTKIADAQKRAKELHDSLPQTTSSQ